MFSRPNRNARRPLSVRLRISQSQRRKLDSVLSADQLRLEYVARGKSIQQIADELGVDYRTVWWRIHDYEIKTRRCHGRGHRWQKGNIPWNKGKPHFAVQGNLNPMKRPAVLQRFKKIRSIVQRQVWRNPVYQEHMRIVHLNQTYPNRNTSIERAVQEALSNRGYQFLTHVPVEGICQPDIVFPDQRVTIFCDGDYFHNLPKQQIKDQRHDLELRRRGWRVIRLWEHEINSDLKSCVDEIEAVLILCMPP